MDINSLDNLFKEYEQINFILSEDTLGVLKSWELEEDAETIAKLRRMQHMSPPGEREKIRKAIEELVRKDMVAGKTTKDVEIRDNYEIYKKWGLNIIKENRREVESYGGLIPDYWYTKAVMSWQKKSTKTFAYVPYSKKMIINLKEDAESYSHSTMFIQKLNSGELTQDLFNKKDIDTLMGRGGNETLYDVITDIDFTEMNAIVTGRTGPFPIRVKDKTESTFYVSIWNEETNSKVLDSMMEKINTILPENFNILLIP